MSARDLETSARPESLANSEVCARTVPRTETSAEVPTCGNARAGALGPSGGDPAFQETQATGPVHRGQFRKGEPGPALKHGRYSQLVAQAALPEQAETLAALAEERSLLYTEQGGESELGVVRRRLADEFLRLSVLATYTGDRLMAEGPLTTKGRQRALLTAHLQITDRLMRLGSALGMERRAKRVPTVEQWMAQQTEESPR